MLKYQSINNNLDKFSTQSLMENKNCFLSHHTALLPYQINTPVPHKIKEHSKICFPCAQVTCHKCGSKTPHILNVGIRWGEWSPPSGNCFDCRETAHRQLAQWANSQSAHDGGIQINSCSALNLNLVVQPIASPFTDSDNAPCKSK